MTTYTPLTPTPRPDPEHDLLEAELLFKEARRRGRRRLVRRAGAIAATTALVGGALGASLAHDAATPASSRDPGPLTGHHVAAVSTCSGSSAVEPHELVISCADANTQLTSTRWSTWSATRASGTTTLAMNLCTPNCASSRLSYFPHSAVVLSRPVATAHGLRFSRMTVAYTWRGARHLLSLFTSGDRPL